MTKLKQKMISVLTRLQMKLSKRIQFIYQKKFEKTIFDSQ